MNADDIAATASWLGFELAGRDYAVPLGDVREIIRPDAPTPVPGAPADVLGIISLRGSIIIVLDGCRRLGLDGGNRGPEQRLVIFQTGDENVAVRIDALRDVLDLDTRELVPPPAGTPMHANDPVLGVLPRGDGSITLLDAGKLCRADEPAMEASA
ncbi:MAG TPA: chemotaxis protein CheW [Rhodanobacteraceae bacterium]|nr:chemotaxis protein CheW [Rhodanobacteraceae bacterium]